MTRLSRAIALAGATAVAVTIALPGAASAAAPELARQSAAVTDADATSTVFAGYTASLSKTISASGTYTVPKLKCTGGDVGIDTFIELAADEGATYSDASVYSSCQSGTPSHTPVFESSVDGQIPIDETVSDGDKIKVTQTFKKGKISLKMENLTAKWTATHTFSGITPDLAQAQQYTITLGGVSVPPVTSGTTFTGVQAGGKDLGTTKPVKTTLVDDKGKAILVPSKITKGTDFKIAPAKK